MQSANLAQHETAAEAVKALGLTVQSTPIPTPQPDAKPGAWELHWTCTVSKDGRPFLVTPYTAGCGHAPSYREGTRWTVGRADAVQRECETMHTRNGAPILPNPLDVLYSLALDADAIDHPTFEDWAADYGFDPDSRSAEATYRTCLAHAVALRAALGDDGLRRLQDAFQDL